MLDANGNEIAATVTWESTQPGQISVNSAGQVTALGDGGSGQITARVGELKSVPLMVFYSQVPAGTLLLTDAQIVGEPEETSPDAAPSMDNTYRVHLSGVAAPAVGQLVMNTEAKIVVGRVRAVSTNANGVHTVTLGLVPLREALPTLRIHETIDLSHAEVTVPADVLANYDVAQVGARYTFMPKVTVAATRANPSASGATARAKAAAASGTSALPPFKSCELTIEGVGGAGSLPVKLDKVPSFTVEFKPALDMVHTPEGGLERLVLTTEPTVTTDISLEFTAGFDGKLTCGIDLLVVRIPTPGPVAAFLSGLVTLGAGMELSGKMALPGVKLGSVTQRSTTLDVGLACPSGGNCSLVHDLGETTVTSKATLAGPDLNDIRLEPSLFGYGKAQASIGNPFFTSLRFDAFYAKLGVALETSLASREGQIADAAYKSSYGLSAVLKAGVDSDFKGLAAWLGLNGVAENLGETALEELFGLANKISLASSPTGSVTLAQDTFKAGDKVEATVKFTDGTTFLGFYNVDEVILMRKVGTAAAQEVARSAVGDGLTELTLSFLPTSDGTANEFYAFVTTRAIPAHALELGQAVAPAPTQSLVQISIADTYACGITVSKTVKCWGANPSAYANSSESLTDYGNVPVEITSLGSGVQSIASGRRHTCAVTAAGSVKCWGFNSDGQLGNGSYTKSAQPVDVVGLDRDVIAVGAGEVHACALTRAGAVKCWGSNFAGQIGADIVDRATPIGVKGLDSGVVALSVGDRQNCVIMSTGTVKCWGGHIVNVDGTGAPYPIDFPELGTGVIAVSAGDNNTCAITSSGVAMCWGHMYLGGSGSSDVINLRPSNVPGLTERVKSISPGEVHTCVVTESGAAKCWGRTALGNGSIAITSGPQDVVGLSTGVQSIDATSERLSCATTTEGTVMCWGQGYLGLLGNGSNLDFSTTPVRVLGFP